MKVLVVKTSSLGDIVQAFPVLSYLYERHPNISVDWVAEKRCAELPRAHPLVHEVLEVDTKLWRQDILQRETRLAIRHLARILRDESYDIVFDLQGNLKSGLITRLTKAPVKVGFDRHSVAEWPNLLFTNHKIAIPPNRNRIQDYLAVVQGYYNDTTPFTPTPLLLQTKTELDNPFSSMIPASACKVMVCPGSAWKNKQVTEKALQDFLIRLQPDLQCSFLFAWGSEEERQTAYRLQALFPQYSVVLPHLPLPHLQNLMHNMKLVVAMDSLPLHLAGLAGVPTFAVFGPSSATTYNPIGEHHIAFQGPCPYGRSFSRRCPVLRTCPTGACIRSLTGEDLFGEFQSRRTRL